jgi:hypothetical protein
MVNLDWRDVPLLTALSYGVASVEADVWSFNDGLLLVGTGSTAGVLNYCSLGGDHPGWP